MVVICLVLIMARLIILIRGYILDIEPDTLIRQHRLVMLIIPRLQTHTEICSLPGCSNNLNQLTITMRYSKNTFKFNNYYNRITDLTEPIVFISKNHILL